MVTVKPVVSLGRTVMPPLLELGTSFLLNLFRGTEEGPGGLKGLRGPWRKWCYVEGGRRE
ncbi:unnamed protein product [Gulo gulo]|uniref:Uncharacterized protein n=1 Tax=Gulo gulo TaxID=48420 RepID=A0A9X9QAU2_GULGU|nr:unnamed protein product [Gulo gulo]